MKSEVCQFSLGKIGRFIPVLGLFVLVAIKMNSADEFLLVDNSTPRFNQRPQNRYSGDIDTTMDSVCLTSDAHERPNLVWSRAMMIGGYSLFAAGIPCFFISRKLQSDNEAGPFSYEGTIRNEGKSYGAFLLYISSFVMIGGGLGIGVFGTVKTILTKYPPRGSNLAFSLVLDGEHAGIIVSYGL